MCAKRQAEILDNAALCLKQNGILVYSTCTLSLEENEYTVESFLDRHNDFELIEIDKQFGRNGYTEKTKLTRKTSAIIVMLCIFTILISLIVFASITLITEASNLLQSLNVYIEKMYNQIQKYIGSMEFDKIEIPNQVISLIQTSTNNLLDFASRWISNFLTSILQGITSLPIIGIYIVITILSTYFICADKMFILDQLEHHFPSIWLKKFRSKMKKIISSLGSYLKAEVTLVGITFLEVLVRIIYF